MKKRRTLLTVGIIAVLSGVLLLAPGSGLAGQRTRPAPALPAEDRMFSGFVYEGSSPKQPPRYPEWK